MQVQLKNTIALPNQDLLQALKMVSGVVESSQVMQILANVHFAVSAQSLTLTTSNSEMEVSTAIAVVAEEPFSFTVSARKLFDISKGFSPEASVELELDDQWLHIKSGSSSFRLATLPADSFPFFHADDTGIQYQLPATQLLRHFMKTSFSMARQDVRIYLNGLFLSFSSEGLKTVSSDGHRMSFMSSEGDFNDDASAIIPRRTVLELVRLLTALGEEPLSITFTDKIAIFQAAGFCLRSQLIDGQFPPYQKLIPQNLEHTITLPNAEMKQVVQRVGICANEKFRGVRFAVEAGRLEISAHNFEQETAKEELPVSYNGEQVIISFNMNYLQEVLQAIDTESLTVSFTHQDSSVLVEPVSDEQTKYIVMPLSLN